MTYPSVHGGGGHSICHTKSSGYDWEDDARKCYTLACNLIGVKVARERLLKLISVCETEE